MDTSRHSQVPMGGIGVGSLQYEFLELMEGGRFGGIAQWFSSYVNQSS